MAVTPNSIVTPQTPDIEAASLTSPTPVTDRTDIVGTTGLTVLTATSTNGKKVYEIVAKAKETTAAGLIFIWLYDGTTSRLFREITVDAVTPSTTAASWRTSVTFDNLVLGATDQLYVSGTIDQDIDVFAFSGVL